MRNYTKTTKSFVSKLLLASALTSPFLVNSAQAQITSTFDKVTQTNNSTVGATFELPAFAGADQTIYATDGSGNFIDSTGNITTNTSNYVELGTANASGATLSALGNTDIRSISNTDAADFADETSSNQIIGINSRVNSAITSGAGTEGYIDGNYGLSASAVANRVYVNRYSALPTAVPPAAADQPDVTYSGQSDIDAATTLTDRAETTANAAFDPVNWGASASTNLLDDSGAPIISGGTTLTQHNAQYSVAGNAVGSEVVFDLPSTGLTSFTHSAEYGGLAESTVTSDFSGYADNVGGAPDGTGDTDHFEGPISLTSASYATGNTFRTSKIITSEAASTEPVSDVAYSSTDANSKIDIDQFTDRNTDVAAINTVSLDATTSLSTIQHNFDTRALGNSVSLGGDNGEIQGLLTDINTTQVANNRSTTNATISTDKLISADNGDTSETPEVRSRTLSTFAAGNALTFNPSSTATIAITDVSFSQFAGAAERDGSAAAGSADAAVQPIITANLTVSSSDTATKAGFQSHQAFAVGNTSTIYTYSEDGGATDDSISTTLSQTDVGVDVAGTNNALQVDSNYTLRTEQALERYSGNATAINNLSTYNIGDGDSTTATTSVDAVTSTINQTTNFAVVDARPSIGDPSTGSALGGLDTVSGGIIELSSNAFGNRQITNAHGAHFRSTGSYNSTVTQTANIDATISATIDTGIAQATNTAHRNIVNTSANSFIGNY